MKTVIMISGKQGSGKSTLSKNLARTLSVGELKTVELLKFAGPLYEMQEAVRSVAKTYGIAMPEKDGLLLQWLGTEWGRNVRGTEVWVNALKYKAENSRADIVIIDDCRFENELNAFDNTRAQVIKIRLFAENTVRKLRADGWRDNEEHPSEIGLDHIPNEQFNLALETQNLSQVDVLTLTLEELKKCGII